MLMPTKLVKPIDSVFVLSSYVLGYITRGDISIDDILMALNKEHETDVSFTKLLLCLDFLYLIGIIECDNETIKVKL